MSSHFPGSSTSKRPARLPRPARVFVLLALAVVAGACTAQPRIRPVKAGDVNTGAGSVEYVRRQLQGSWTLSEFDAADASGRLHRIKAAATLQYDEFGNMKVIGKLLEPLPGGTQGDTNAELNYEGQIFIDPAKQEFRLQSPGVDANVDPALQQRIGTQQARKYDIQGNVLTITYVRADGMVVAKTLFHRGGTSAP